MTGIQVLRGGIIVDGSGAPQRAADLVLDGPLIVAVGAEVAVPPGAAIVDVTGLIIAPGFIDIHTHSDVSVLVDGRAESKVMQGVTTEVVGNCGFSAFPIQESVRGEQIALLAGIGDDPIDPDWTDFAGYSRTLSAAGTAVNVAALVGHGQLRLAAAGMAESLSTGQLDRMAILLEKALVDGAFGMSTGLTYVPSSYATPEELTRLAEVLLQRHALYATHARGAADAAVAEAISLGESTGVRVQFSHISINDPAEWGSAHVLLSQIDEARARGVDIECDVYPYAASSSALTQYLPSWTLAGGVDAMAARLADEPVRERAEQDLARGWGPGGKIAWDWDRVLLSRTDGLCGATPGETLAVAAQRLGKTPPGLMLELCRQGGNRVQVVLFYRVEEDVQAFLAHPHTTLGSDGSALPHDLRGRHPHPRAYGAHARLLGRYVRELGTLNLETAIHKMTGAVANRLRIEDRGQIAVGKFADLVVFDASTISDRASFTEPAVPPTGVVHVFVNGLAVVRDGIHTGALPGRVLRSTDRGAA